MSDMRDGPHRNLPLSRSWKRVAERLDNGNYSVVEVGVAWSQALREDWQSDSVPEFWGRLLAILRPSQPDMFPPATQLDTLRRQADGHGIRTELLEHAYGLREAPLHEEVCVRMVRQVLFDISDRRRNQIVAHYRCEAPSCAPSIERSLEGQWPEYERIVIELAEELATGSGKRVAPLRRDSLDDGVPA